MLRRTFALLTVAAALCMLVAPEAAATSQRTFVSSTGNDANPCSLTLPCRSFTSAISQTSSGGELIVLDSAGYGPVTINQALSIIAPPGVYAGISVTSGTGITVNTGLGTVVLSGLTINGLGGSTGGLFGIDFQSGSTLRIERTTVSGFYSNGLNVVGSVAATLIIRNSAFNANHNGIWAIGNSSGGLTVEVDDSRFDQNTNSGAGFHENVSGVISGSSFTSNSVGLVAQTVNAATRMTIRNSVFLANQYGIVLGGIAGSATITQVTDSEISDNSNSGASVQLAATLTLSNTTVTRNGVGINLAGGGIAISFQDNRLYGNTTDGSFTSTIAKQ